MKTRVTTHLSLLLLLLTSLGLAMACLWPQAPQALIQYLALFVVVQVVSCYWLLQQRWLGPVQHLHRRLLAMNKAPIELAPTPSRFQDRAGHPLAAQRLLGAGHLPVPGLERAFEALLSTFHDTLNNVAVVSQRLEQICAQLPGSSDTDLDACIRELRQLQQDLGHDCTYVGSHLHNTLEAGRKTLAQVSTTRDTPDILEQDLGQVQHQQRQLRLLVEEQLAILSNAQQHLIRAQDRDQQTKVTALNAMIDGARRGDSRQALQTISNEIAALADDSAQNHSHLQRHIALARQQLEELPDLLTHLEARLERLNTARQTQRDTQETLFRRLEELVVSSERAASAVGNQQAQLLRAQTLLRAVSDEVQVQQLLQARQQELQQQLQDCSDKLQDNLDGYALDQHAPALPEPLPSLANAELPA